MSSGRPNESDPRAQIGGMQQLAQRLQQLHATLGAGGEYPHTRAEFEQAFNIYKQSLMSLIFQTPYNEQVKNEQRIVVAGGADKVQFRDYKHDGFAIGTFSICAYRDVPETLFLVLDAPHQYQSLPDDPIFTLNNLFPSMSGGSFVKNITTSNSNRSGYQTDYRRPLEVEDLLNDAEIPIETRFAVYESKYTLMQMFLSGTGDFIDYVSKNFDWRISSMRDAIPQILVQETLAAAVNPDTPRGTGERPLTRADVEAIVNASIAVHPVIKRLEQQGVSEDRVRELIEAVVASSRPTEQPVRRQQGMQLTDAQINQAVDRVAGSNNEARSALQKFIDERVKTATDPERVFSALLAIVGGFVPGAAQVVAVAQALNILFAKRVVVEESFDNK